MYKRFVSIFLGFAIALSLGVNVYANAPESEIQQIAALVNDLFPTVVAVEGIPVETMSLGAKLSVYRVGLTGLEIIDYDVYPILSNQQVVAFAKVNYNNADNMQVSCGLDFADELRQYLSLNNSAFAIVYANEGVFVANTNGVVQCIKEQITSVPYSIEDVNLNAETFSTSPIVSVQALSLGVIPRVALSVQQVDNDSASCCGGLCWAASIAMIANYYENMTYDAMDVHDLLGCLGIRPTNSTFVSGLYEMGMYTHTFSYDNLTYNLMYSYVEDGTPLFMHLHNTGAGDDHAVVGVGYQYTTSVQRLFIRDPNSGFQSINFPTSGNVEMTLDGYNYELNYYIVVRWTP